MPGMWRSVRKGLIKAKFRPGVLTRVYGKRIVAKVKPSMIGSSDYYASCLHMLYPDKVDSSGIRALNAQIPAFGCHLKKLLSRLHPAQLHDAPNH